MKNAKLSALLSSQMNLFHIKVMAVVISYNDLSRGTLFYDDEECRIISNILLAAIFSLSLRGGSPFISFVCDTWVYIFSKPTQQQQQFHGDDGYDKVPVFIFFSEEISKGLCNHYCREIHDAMSEFDVVLISLERNHLFLGGGILSLMLFTLKEARGSSSTCLLHIMQYFHFLRKMYDKCIITSYKKSIRRKNVANNCKLDQQLTIAEAAQWALLESIVTKRKMPIAS